jgi:hypothetical protein
MFMKQLRYFTDAAVNGRKVFVKGAFAGRMRGGVGF